jgi:hypothetical protein
VQPKVLAGLTNGEAAVRALGSRLPEVARNNGMTAAGLRRLLREDGTFWLDSKGRGLFRDVFDGAHDGHTHGDPSEGHDQAGSAHTPPTHGAAAADGGVPPNVTVREELAHARMGAKSVDHDPVAAPGSPKAAAAAASASGAAPYPLDQTFLLNSKPGSPRVIYLDFDGHTVSGTAWNDESSLAPGSHPAFSLDGDPTTFNAEERTLIQGVWQRVAEDFAPFDVNVTTQDPGIDAIRRTNAADTTYGTRVLITPSTSAINALCGGNCGGVAYIGNFAFTEPGHSYYQPTWVFPQALSNDEKAIAEAATHEAGHNLGLLHHGTSTQPYYVGHGPWAPIMGIGYGRPVTQWSQGEYSGADNSDQDDLAEIQDHGLALRSQDHASASSGATSLGSGAWGSKLSATGIISTRTDVDVFSFTQTCAGPTRIGVTPAPTSPNLDTQLRVLDASGTLLTSVDPPVAMVSADLATGLDAVVELELTAGTYHLAVDGRGFGNPLNAGYSDYGSLGAYTVEVEPCRAEVPPNDAFAAALSVASLPFVHTQATHGATTELGEPAGCATDGGTSGATVWFRYTSPVDQSLTVDTLGSDFDTVLGVYTGAELGGLTEVACNDDAGGLPSQVTFPATAGTTYHLQVGGWQGSGPPASGQLSLSLTTALDPGRLSATPASVGFGEVSVGADTSRSTLLTNVGGQALTISEVSLSGSDAFSPALVTPRQLGPGASVDVVVGFAPSTAGGHAATITLVHDGVEGPLAIPVTGTGVEPESICPPDDDLEPNNWFDVPTPLAPGTTIDAIACAEDPDVFVVDLAAGQTLTADLEFSHAEGDLDLLLFEPAGGSWTLLAASDSVTDNERIVHQAARTGPYYLYVEGWEGAQARYRLTVNVSGSPPPPPDGLTCDGVEPLAFPDVNPTGTHGPSIGCAAALGIVTGFQDGSFGPARTLTRAQFASILFRALERSGLVFADAPLGFADVSPTSVHAPAIRKLAAAGIIAGRSASEFAPDRALRKPDLPDRPPRRLVGVPRLRRGDRGWSPGAARHAADRPGRAGADRRRDRRGPPGDRRRPRLDAPMAARRAGRDWQDCLDAWTRPSRAHRTRRGGRIHPSPTPTPVWTSRPPTARRAARRRGRSRAQPARGARRASAGSAGCSRSTSTATTEPVLVSRGPTGSARRSTSPAGSGCSTPSAGTWSRWSSTTWS